MTIDSGYNHGCSRISSRHHSHGQVDTLNETIFFVRSHVFCCSGSVLHDVCQKQLETVVPRPGELVLVLRGAQKMQRARLLQKDSKVMLLMSVHHGK
jgi:hypothetical protein